MNTNGTTTLEFKWTTSRGRDTYGYNICTLYADGRKVARCNGGGYDMQGTCLGDFIAHRYKDRLLKLKAEDMPSQSHWESNHKRRCAGECYATYMKALGDAIADGKGFEFEKSVELELYDRDTFECPRCHGDTTYGPDMGKKIDDGHYFYGLTFHDPNYDPSKAVIGQDCSDRTLSNESAEGKTVGEAEAEGISFGLERYQAIYSASSKTPTERHTIPSIDGACGFSSVERIAKAIGLELQYVPQRRGARNSIYLLHDKQNGEERAA